MKRISALLFLALLFLAPMAAFAAERYTPPGYSGVLVRSQAPTTSVEMSSMPHPDPEEPPPPPPPPPPSPGGNGGDGGDGGDGGAGGQGGGGGEGGSVGDIAATGGNVGDINMTSGGVNIRHPRQVASAYAPAVFPTAICEGGQSIGVQTSKWGVSWTKSDSRREACLFALAQQWMSMGEYELACDALVQTKAASFYGKDNKPSCVGRRGPAPLMQSQPQSQPTIIVLPVGAPGADFDEKLKRAFEAAMASPK